MRRTFLCLMASILMYGIYIYNLPRPAASVAAAQTTAEPRITAQFELDRIRLYAVALGVYDTETEARLAAARYTLRGAAGCIEETEDGWALLGAGYASNAEAASVCRQLAVNENIAAQVMLFGAEGLRISMTAARSQSAAVSAALDSLSVVPGELMSLSGQLDSGACDTATIRSLISIKAAELQIQLTNLSDVLGVTADIFCRIIETNLAALCERMAVLSTNDGPSGLMLSSCMKQCALETQLGIIDMLHTLSRGNK